MAEPGESGRARARRHHRAHRHRQRHAGRCAAVRAHREGIARAARGPRVRRAQRALRLRLHPARVRARWARRGAAPNLCTVRLSRALYPEMPRHNLDAVMERHGIHIENRHRAMPDAQALLAFWRKLRAAWPREELQSALDSARQRATLPAALPPDLARRPARRARACTVSSESAKTAGDTLLYVGKANNLRERVLDHFRGGARRREVAEARRAGAARGVDRNRGRARRAAARGARSARTPAGLQPPAARRRRAAHLVVRRQRGARRSSWNSTRTCCARAMPSAPIARRAMRAARSKDWRASISGASSC